MRTTRLGLALLAALILLGLDPLAAFAQEPAQTEMPPEVRARGRRLQEEGRAHVEAQQWALAAQTYQEIYELSSEYGVPVAPIALWNVGLALMRIPGREAEARDAFQRFLHESTTLTDDPQVRDWRSTAVEHIAELDARIGVSASYEHQHVESTDANAGPDDNRSTNTDGAISPVGPILLGIGGAALVAAAIVAPVLASENDALVAMCPDGTCPSSARTRAEGVQSIGLAEDILVIGGAVIAITGLILTLVLRDHAEEIPATVTCTPAGCGLHARGTF